MYKHSLSSSFLELIIGPMFAGKTTELMRKLNLYNEMGLRVIYINHSIDDRNKEEFFSTHNPTLKSSGKIIERKAEKIGDVIEVLVKDFDVIGIDEGQFFSDLFSSVQYLVEDCEKVVIITGLDSDCKRREFGEIIKLIPLCDKVKKLTAFCTNCKENKNIIRPAIFTKKIIDDREEIIIDIGGKDKYIPVCRDCYR